MSKLIEFAELICDDQFTNPEELWIGFGIRFSGVNGFQPDAAARDILNAEKQERIPKFVRKYLIHIKKARNSFKCLETSGTLLEKLIEDNTQEVELRKSKLPKQLRQIFNENKKKFQEFARLAILPDDIKKRFGSMPKFSEWRVIDEILDIAVYRVLGIIDALERIEACMVHILEIPVKTVRETAVFIRDAFLENPDAAAFILTNSKEVSHVNTEYEYKKPGVSLNWINAFISGVCQTSSSSYIFTEGDMSTIHETSITQPGEAAKMLHQLVTRMAVCSELSFKGTDASRKSSSASVISFHSTFS